MNVNLAIECIGPVADPKLRVGMFKMLRDRSLALAGSTGNVPYRALTASSAGG